MFQKYLQFFKRAAEFIFPKGNDKRSLLEKLRDNYRLVIIDDDTLAEVTSLKLSPLSVYIAISSLVVGTAIFVTLLIVWTPLKRYIPGYGDFQRDSEVAQLLSENRKLEREIVAIRNYVENFRNILVGDHSKMTKSYVEKQGIPPDSNSLPIENVERISEDQTLREAVAMGTVTTEFEPSEMPSGHAMLARDRPLEQMYFVPPVSGQITASFSPGKEHYGVDVAAAKNTAVKSAADGVVIFAGYTVDTGYSIAIQHPNNVVTMYKHNSILLKKTGSQVRAGEAIAIVGNTGEQSTGPHLHFELWYMGRPVDANKYIHFN